MDRRLTPPQLAEAWGCTPQSVIALIKRGALKAFTLSPPTCKRPRWLITPEAVEEFERTHGPGEAPKPVRRRQRPREENYIEYV